jgi:2,3-bisphosphoglycerate-independent phosphoglycerate mutase
VTKFFNGGRGEPFEGETDLLIPSHKVATYDADPAMSAMEIFEAFVQNESAHPFAVVNLANGDMVGHTGNMAAAVKAVETLDATVGKFIRLCQETGRDLLITADHGNIEEMGTSDAPMTAHTCNPVPFWHVRDGEAMPTRLSGGLADIAPTVLELM